MMWKVTSYKDVRSKDRVRNDSSLGVLKMGGLQNPGVHSASRFGTDLRHRFSSRVSQRNTTL